MVIRKVLLVSIFAVLAFAAAPSRASADWYLTPFVGGNFNGNANFGGNNTFDDQVERRVDFGASFGGARLRLVAEFFSEYHRSRQLRLRRQ